MTIGEFLRRAREDKKLTLEQIAEGTNIRIHYLEAIEKDKLELLPSLAQARGFSRLYAAFLGINPVAMMQEIEDAKKSVQSGVTPEQQETQVQEPGPQLTTKTAESNPAELVKKIRKLSFGKARKEPEKKPVAGKTPSAMIFEEIGVELKRQRESLGLSLADVERQIKIREYYLFALENGKVDDLPSTVQGRGMLNNYASFMNLHSEPLQIRYAEGLQKRREERAKLEEETRKTGIQVKGGEPLTGWRRFLTPDLLIGGSVFAILFILVIWGAIKVIQTSNPEQIPTVSSISEVLIRTATLEFPMTEVTVGETPSPVVSTEALNTLPVDLQATLTAVSSGPIQVSVVAYQRVFVKITVDGKDVYTGRVVPGNVYTYSGKTKIILLTGDAAGIQVYYNNEDLGILGQSGQVVSLEFTTKTSATSTPQFPPTPTRTQPATLTPQPTKTPTPTEVIPTATITPAIPTAKTP